MKHNHHSEQCAPNSLPALHSLPALRNGFSLVELMVALVIGSILLGAVLLIFTSSKKTYDVQDQSARMQENGRYAIEVLLKDIRLAGYWGGNADRVIKTANSVAPTTSGCDATNWSKMISQRLYGLNDTNNDSTTTGNYTNAACIPTYVRGDVLTVRHAQTTPVVAASLGATGIYTISDMDAAGLFTGTTVPSEVTIDSGGSHVLAEPNAIYPVVTHAYHIRTGTSSCPVGQSAPAPSLYRLVATTTAGPTAEEVISGVENFQVQYGVDTSAAKDSSEIQFFNASSTLDWANIVAVRVWLLLRSLCPESNYTNTNTYAMGDQSLTFNDAFRRQIFTTTIMLRNRK